jgi:guanylate kinase
MSAGTLFVVSAPSGAGKTSLVRELRTRLDGFTVSVSHTTRPQRPGEIHGREYFFVSRDEFDAMVANGDFLEHAQVFDNYYGTARSTVEHALRSGCDVLLEIDWQGARQIKTQLPNCQTIFILPPALTTLEQRLKSRGQDGDEVIARRMRDAISEMTHYGEFDYLVVNDDFEFAVTQLVNIVTACRLRTPCQRMMLKGLLDDLLR